MLLQDLEWLYDEKPTIGCKIYLIRKISNHVLETEFTHYLSGTNPAVYVRWKSFTSSLEYKLDLLKNQVLAIDATVKHRTEMKIWYSIFEPQRKQLIELFHAEKKKKKRYSGK
jgi:heme oxygenase